MKKGVGLTAIHWSTGAATGKIGQRYLQTLGGWFNTEFSTYHVRKSIMQRVSPKHPISRGWSDYELTDEYYIQLKFRDDVHPISAADVNGQTYTIGWAFERPDGNDGRSFGFIGGHFHKNFAIDAFRQTIVNGILWTAHAKIPKTGAPCAITEKDMELPPDTRKK